MKNISTKLIQYVSIASIGTYLVTGPACKPYNPENDFKQDSRQLIQGPEKDLEQILTKIPLYHILKQSPIIEVNFRYAPLLLENALASIDVDYDNPDKLIATVNVRQLDKLDHLTEDDIEEYHNGNVIHHELVHVINALDRWYYNTHNEDNKVPEWRYDFLTLRLSTDSTKPVGDELEAYYRGFSFEKENVGELYLTNVLQFFILYDDIKSSFLYLINDNVKSYVDSLHNNVVNMTDVSIDFFYKNWDLIRDIKYLSKAKKIVKN